MKWFLVGVALTFTAGMAPAEGTTPSVVARKVEEISRRTRRFVYRLGGRVRGADLRLGMTPEEVDQILGEGGGPIFFFPPEDGSFIVWKAYGCEAYGGLGVDVFFRSDKAGKLRAERIEISPLLY
jgi:hypothetical protein